MPGKGGLFDLNQTKKMFKDRFRKNHPKAEAVLPLSVKPERLARTSAGSWSMTTPEENQCERNVGTGGLDIIDLVAPPRMNSRKRE
jgi:hypothetical protein